MKYFVSRAKVGPEQKDPPRRTRIYIVASALLTLFSFIAARGVTLQAVLGLIITATFLWSKTRRLAENIAPFILVGVGYRVAQLIAGELSIPLHVTDIIDWERAIFGTIPTLKLQALLHLPTGTQWYDYILTIGYLSFYVWPYFFALVLWRKRRDVYHHYLDGFIILTGIGYLIYAFFPAVPPWMASLQGHLPAVPKLLNETLHTLGLNIDAVYRVVGANQVAAMPSLHAAWPWYILLCLIVWQRRQAYWFAVVPPLIWFAIVYFGEHYIIDVMAGVVLATIAFAVAWHNQCSAAARERAFPAA